jgi:hypothetical protein
MTLTGENLIIRMKNFFSSMFSQNKTFVDWVGNQTRCSALRGRRVKSLNHGKSPDGPK